MPRGPVRAGSGLVGTARGRALAAALALLAVGALATLVLAAEDTYLALRPLLQSWVVLTLGAAAAAGLAAAAAWLLTRTRPWSLVIRILAGFIAPLCAGVVGWGLLAIDWRSEILREEVRAVSPDGRFEVVRLEERGLEGRPAN